MIKTAVIGYGLSAKVFHLPFIEENEQYKLCYIQSSRSDEIKKDFPDVKQTTSYEEILKSDVELIIITTPNEFHFDLCQQALSSNKHVVVEKPFTVTSSQASQLIQLAEKMNKIIAVYHNRRLDGDFLTIKELMANNKLGKINYFESHFDRHRPQSKNLGWREENKPGSGFLYDLGSHLIDQALVLFGKPKALFCDLDSMRENTNVDDYFHLILYYENMRAVLHSTNIGVKSDLRFKIHGESASFIKYHLDPQEGQLKNKVKLSETNFGLEEVESYGKLYHAEKVIDIKTHKGSYQQFYLNLVNSIQQNTPFFISPKEAKLVIEIIEKAFESAKQGIKIDL
jgi:scyllo-inositol 2-dehydrogenase (NADP+)